MEGTFAEAEARARTVELRALLVAGVVAAIAVGYVLSRLATVRRFPLFIDESTYATWTLQGFQDSAGRFLSLKSQVQPMVMWIGMGFMKLGADPVTAVRLVSFCAGILCVTCLALLGIRAGGWRVGLTAAALYVLLPISLVHDSLGLLDPLVAACSTAALYLQLRLAERPRLDLAFVLGLVFAVALLTKSTGLYAVLLLPASLLCFDWTRTHLVRRLGAWLGYAALAVGLGLLGRAITKLSEWYVPLSPSGSAPRTTRPIGIVVERPWHWIAQTWPALQAGLTGYLTWPVLGFTALGAAVLIRRRGRLAVVLALWVAIPILADLTISTEQYTRLVLSSVPPIVVFAAYGAGQAWSWLAGMLSPMRARWTAAVVASLALVPALSLDATVLASPATAVYPGLAERQYVTGWQAGGPWKPLVAELRRAAGGRKATVAVTTYGQAPVILLYRDRNFSFVPADDHYAFRSDFVIVNPGALPAEDDRSTLRVLGRWQRPRGGATATLYQRGIYWRGTFYTSPKAFRAGLHLLDPAFDAFLGQHPLISHWYEIMS